MKWFRIITTSDRNDKQCGGLDLNADFINKTWTNRMECIKKVQGKVDIELNATGIKQAEETALKLKIPL